MPALYDRCQGCQETLSILGYQETLSTLVKLQEGAGNLVAEWNAQHPEASIRKGDHVIQAGVYVSLENIFAYLGHIRG